MNITVKKIGEEYCVIFNQPDFPLIKKCIIKKSWDKDFIEEVIPREYDLYKNDIELFKKEYNLITVQFKLEEPFNIFEFYIITLVDIYDNEYRYFLDYNKFNSVATENTLYKFKVNNDIADKKKLSRYTFYIKGAFGDIHKIKLISVLNSNELIMMIPEKTLLKSPYYSLLTYLNNDLIDSTYVNILTSDTIDFVLDIKEYDTYFKYTLNPKFNYPQLSKIEIRYKDKCIVCKKGDLKNISFFLPSHSVKDFNELSVGYILNEDTLNPTTIQKETVIYSSPYKNETIEIYDFEHKYSFSNDSMYISWKNKSSRKNKYKIFIEGNTFYTTNTYLLIKDFKSYNNNKLSIPIQITADLDTTYSINHFDTIPNYFKIDSPNKFIPQIDYSDCLYCSKPTGTLKWTFPKHHYYSAIKVEVLHVSQFLDEYIQPWNDSRILDKTPVEFDEKYTDYEKLIEYDFPIKEQERKKRVLDTLISYDGTKQEMIFLGETNQYELPLWYCQDGYEYKITIQIFDRWMNILGSNSCNFPIYDNQVGEVTDDWLWFNRNQNIQFGETGTIGDYFKVTNPTPIDVMKHYSPLFKEYKGKALYNLLNTDKENNSLYYFFNTNEGERLEIKYKRTYNFYEIECSFYNEKKELLHIRRHKPQGNSYDDNHIYISKSIFNKEGKYIMQIKTFNAAAQSSRIKETNFFVFNEKPDMPYLKINEDDYKLVDGKTIINKKYFNFQITNNALSEKYAGWKFKEVHFFFKKLDEYYNEYADYVVLAEKEDGDIILNNTAEIENGEYECKIVAYDYAANASEPYIFQFELISEIKITPEKLFTNDLLSKFKWKILKSQDSEGFYYFFRLSKDGINFKDSNIIKVESPYYIDDSNTEQEHILDTHWLTEDNVTFDEGYYKLVVYEWNKKHPEGIQEYQFESDIVDVSLIANPSQPIYAIDSEHVKVFNKKQFDEYVYTDNLNSVTFETIHSEQVLDDPDTVAIEGQFYKIQMVDPSGNIYSGTLPIPTEVGMYHFTNIADVCNIVDQTEGVWDLRFITVDKYGNDNTHRGYYTYQIALVTRNPRITSLVTTNSTGSNIFGLTSAQIGYFVSARIYEDIANYEKHKEKFKINKFELNMLTNPSGSSYTISILANDRGIIDVVNPLTDEEKLNHSRDGKYLIEIACTDPLGRKSDYESRSFYIDTQLNGELLFVNNNIFYQNIVDLVATASGEVKNIYYSFDLDNKDFYTWDKTSVSEVKIGEQIVNGIEIKNITFNTDGTKTMQYVLEEESGNTSNIKHYNFIVDTSIKLLPIFDYDNKVFYTNESESLFLSWNMTNEDVTQFLFKLDKIEIQEDGSVIIVESYMPMLRTSDNYVPVGPGKNDFIDLKESKELEISLVDNGFLNDGYYMITVKGINIYGTFTENTFRFQIDKTTPLDIAYEILNNKITIDSNIITWNHIREASSYELSYDNKTWTKTIENRFMIDSDKVMKDENGQSYIFMKWRTHSGIYSTVSKIFIQLNVSKLETPKVNFYANSTITENNKNIEWIIEIPDPEKAKYIYYTFDNNLWFAKKIKQSIENIINTTVTYPVPDGRYDIFVRTTDENPLNEKYFNKSDLVHASVDIFSQEIETPIFSGIKNGQHLSLPTKLFITNKNPKVQYFIFVNDTLVPEGYEISSSTLKKYDIRVKAKKIGLENVYDLIDDMDNLHVYSLTTEQYTISIGNSKVLCVIDDSNSQIEIQSMPNKRNSEVIMYRRKNTSDKWTILRVGDKLSLNIEWEFHITTFSMI